jgi:hypothetical protein
LGVLKAAPKGGVGIGIGSPGFYSNDDLFTNPGKILGHFIPAGKHGGFTYFKYSSHNEKSKFKSKKSKPGIPQLQDSGLQIYGNEGKRKTALKYRTVLIIQSSN